jgi:hypothetical protein
VLTFNYDVAFDHALDRRNVGLHYGLDRDALRNEIPLLKLHGSTNWIRCSECDEIHFWPVRDYLAAKTPDWMFALRTEGSVRQVQLSFGRSLLEWPLPPKCQTRKPDETEIIPPTSAKHDRHRQLAAIWRQAAAVLAQTEHLVIVGYSWPLTDQFFHQLFALGTISETLIRKVIVLDTNAEMEGHYRKLLGEQLRASRFEFIKRSFGDYDVCIPAICNAMGIDTPEPERSPAGQIHFGSGSPWLPEKF